MNLPWQSIEVSQRRRVTSMILVAIFDLARGIGEYDDFVAGLEGVVESDEVVAADYLTLAYGYQLLGKDVLAKKALRDGMAKFPENAEMPMRLAYAYSDAKRYRDAQEIIRLHPEIGTAVEPTRLYLILNAVEQ